MAKKIQNKFTIQTPIELAKDIEKYIKNYNYSGPAELFRDSIREKLYGKTRGNEIINKFLSQIEEEKEFTFKENKDIYKRLKNIAKKF